MISEIQQYLAIIRKLYPNLPAAEVTGVYDEATENVIRTFQIMKGLPATGFLDLLTLEKLVHEYNEYLKRNKLAGSIPVHIPEFEEVKLGDRKDIVYNIKIILNKFSEKYKNYPKLEINDLYDIKTQEAVRSFQERSMLPPTGVVDINTWNTLVKIYGTCKLCRTFPNQLLIPIDN